MTKHLKPKDLSSIRAYLAVCMHGTALPMACKQMNQDQYQVQNQTHGLYPGPNMSVAIPMLGLAQRFGHMFTGKALDLQMHPTWLTSFADTCADIDTVLGKDKRGFHWTLLDMGWDPKKLVLCWHFSLNPEHDIQLGVTVDNGNLFTQAVYSEGDKHAGIRLRLLEVVAQGKLEAVVNARAVQTHRWLYGETGGGEQRGGAKSGGGL